MSGRGSGWADDLTRMAGVDTFGIPEAGGGANSTATFPEFADRAATDHGWAALAFPGRSTA